MAALALLWCLGARPAAAGDRAADYRAWLAREERFVRRAADACRRTGGASLGPLRRAAALAASPGPGLSPEDTAWLARDCARILEAKPAARQGMLAGLMARIGAYRRATLIPPPGVDPERARAELRRVFSRPEFAWRVQRQPWWRKLWLRIMDLFRRWLNAVFSAPATGRIVVAVAAVGAVLLLALVFLAIRGRPRGTAETGAGTDAASQAGGRGGRREDLRRRAEEAARDGRFREAVRLLYVALLQELDRMGLIKLAKAKTNWDYRREIEAGHRRLSPVFRSFTDLYELKWYGQDDCRAGDYERARTLFDEARGAAR